MYCKPVFLQIKNVKVSPVVYLKVDMSKSVVKSNSEQGN